MMANNSLPESLSAKYEGTFAYLTVKDRLPEILTRALDTFHREWKDHVAQEDQSKYESEVKAIISDLSKLRYLMMTNKELEPLEGKEAADYTNWVDAMKKEETESGQSLAWFDSRWLFVECYLYKRISDIFIFHGRKFQNFDPFETQKKDALKNNMTSAEFLGTFLSTSTSSDLQSWIELSLWGNRCDLSLKSTTPSFEHIVDHLAELRKKIIVNDTSLVTQRFESLKELDQPVILDIILDNSGFELFTDLCLLHFLTEIYMTTKLVKKIRIHVKSIPWFVSDVMRKDFLWTLSFLENVPNNNVKSLAMKWKTWTSSGLWEVVDSNFWTMPYDFDAMKKECPPLYSLLQESSLIFFKGDLNYRKLLGDLNWPHTIPFLEAIRSFKPSFFVTLRTNKADILVGLTNPEVEKDLPKDFLVTGEYAVIQVNQ